MHLTRTPRLLPWATAALILGAALALALAAGTRPSYDAYGWLTWGRMTVHGRLDTNAAPSFKPLPFLFTVPEGLLPGAAMRLWLITSIAASLAGLLVAGRLAWWLAGRRADPARVAPGGARAGEDRPGSRRLAGGVAAALAVVGILCIHDEFPFGYAHYVLSAQSDPMIVAATLGAIDCARRGRAGATFGLLVLAALGRPEVWPFLVLDAAWLWRARPSLRGWLVAGIAVVGLGWFGVPALSSRSWLVAAENASASGFGPRGNRVLGVLGRLWFQLPWPLWAAAALALARAVLRRDRVVGALAACVVLWTAVEIAFALHGWPALGRYLFEASALVVVLGAGLVGSLLDAALHHVPRTRPAPRVAIGGLLALAVIGGTVAFAIDRGRQTRADLLAQQARTRSIDHLTSLVGRLGGPARVRACGEAISDGLATQTVLAFTLTRNVSAVGYRFPQPGHPHDPIVVFRPLHDGGWSARALRQVSTGCRRLQARGTVVLR